MKHYPITVHGEYNASEFRLYMPEAKVPVLIAQDVFGEMEKMCQLVIHESDPDIDPALHVRLNDDGTVAEILIREDLRGVVTSMESDFVSDWLKRRDGE